MKIESVLTTAPIPIIVISFRNPGDVRDALTALAKAEREPAFSVHICENGGGGAFDALVAMLDDATDLVARGCDADAPRSHAFRAMRTYRMAGSDVCVLVGDAGQNLGFGGGVNLWLKALEGHNWPGVFVLNPDAAPAPDALRQLKTYAETAGKGMVTGRIVLEDALDQIQTRGLRFRRWLASTEAVDRLAASAERPVAADVERRLDAPSGAALYVTQACLKRIGPMREDFFLYYEDLDWGLKAKTSCGLGYAFDAVIVHKGGTTIGTGTKRGGSPFSAYLEFRNCLLFVRATMPLWFPWAVAVRLLRAAELVVVGRPDRAWAALRGIAAGLAGRSGRPDAMLERHLASR